MIKRKDFRLTPIQMADARKAILILEGTGMTIEAAAMLCVNKLGGSAIKSKLTFENALDQYKRHISTRLRLNSQYTYGVVLDNFGSVFADRYVNEIKRDEIMEYLNGMTCSGSTKRAVIRILCAFYSWACKQNARFCTENPARGMDTSEFKGSSQKKGRTAYFTVKEVEHILTTCPNAMLPAFALATYAGIRPEEVAMGYDNSKTALQWEDINIPDRVIRIPGSTSKVDGADRLSDGLPEALWILLDQYTGKREGPIAPVSKKTKNHMNWKAIRQAIGIAAGWCTYIPFPSAPGKPPQVTTKWTKKWHRDITRHTFATYMMAVTQNAAQVCEWTGHEGGSKILRKHYLGLATKAQGEEFLALPAKIFKKKA